MNCPFNLPIFDSGKDFFHLNGEEEENTRKGGEKKGGFDEEIKTCYIFKIQLQLELSISQIIFTFRN